MKSYSLILVALSGLTLVSSTTEPVHNLHVRLMNKTEVKVDFDKPVGVSNGEIDSYKVEVRQMFHEMLEDKTLVTKPPTTHMIVRGLYPKVVYNLRVYVIMKDKNMAMSPILRFTTEQANATEVCLCDPFGSHNATRNGTCTPNLVDCSCRQHYTGSHCSICGPGHYRKLFQRCERCPCYKKTSSGNCMYDPTMHRARCVHCKNHGAGPLCEICVPGYFRRDPKDGPCIPCRCPRLHNPDRPSRCRMITGDCFECPNGTTGLRCGSCIPGWSGVAPNCSPGVSLLHSSVTVVTALVALLCVAGALLLGYWAMRVRARRKRLNMWSLELNRYELEAPGGLVDSASHSGLMMEEAPAPTSSRLQLRQNEAPVAAETKTNQLV